MSAISFDDKFIQFESTPVNNIFFTEHMPSAPGDYVKVYLYGLFKCHYPSEGTTVDTIAHDLMMEAEDVEKAFKYWEVRHLVWRTSTNPAAYQYISPYKIMLSGEEAAPDEDYAAFTRQLNEEIPDGKWYSQSKIQRCYEWHTDSKMHLPTEVIIALIRHMTDNGAKSLPISVAEKNATMLSEEGAQTREDAEEIFARDQKTHDQCRNVLKKLGEMRNPTQPEIEMYKKWRFQWLFTEDAILAAIDKTVAASHPTFAYIDGILAKTHESNPEIHSADDMREHDAAKKEERSGLRQLLRVFSQSDVAINNTRLKIYREMRQLFGQDIILLAANACVRFGEKKDLDDVLQTLKFWASHDVRTYEQAKSSVDETQRLHELAKKVLDAAGVPGVPTKENRSFVREMENNGFSDDMILYCAQRAQGKGNPISYFKGVMTGCLKEGTMTPEQAEAAAASRKSKNLAKTDETRYTQRDYSDVDEMPQWMKEELEGNA